MVKTGQFTTKCTSRAQIYQLPYDFAGKGMLNVLGGVLPK